MSGRLYTLTGSSGSGKTTLLNLALEEPYASKLSVTKAPKYSSREQRDANDDVIHDVNLLKGATADFDVLYYLNGNTYGLKTSEIFELLDSGRNAVIILSDLRVVRRLKRIFGSKMRSIYVASAIDPEKLRAIQEQRHVFAPEPQEQAQLARQFARLNSAARLGLWRRVFECVGELNREWKSYIPEAESTEIRAQRIRAFHTRYVDNIALFDNVILNYTEGCPEEMLVQFSNLLASGRRFGAIEKTYPPIFIVAAASGAGKGTLMSMLDLIGGGNIAITTKMARRKKKPHDKRDGMIALGRRSFPEDFDLRWRFHVSKEFSGTEYAVSSREIGEHVADNIPQIFVSNMGQFDRFLKLYGERVVLLYLHRLTSEDQARAFQEEVCQTQEEAEVRIREVRKVHEAYMERVGYFDHVLLNTTFPEDLYDQMLQLLECYQQQGELKTS